MLRPQPDLIEYMRKMVDAGKSANLPYRMSEGNSCYNGGKAGVSNSFASALWGADFMLLLAQIGVAEITFTAEEVATIRRLQVEAVVRSKLVRCTMECSSTENLLQVL